MFLGVIVCEEGGAPVLIKGFSKVFDEQKATYLSQLVEALKTFAEVTLGDRLEEIRLGTSYIYLRKLKKFTISVITDNPEPGVEKIIHGISNIIKDFTPDEILLNKKIKEKILQRISSLVIIEKSIIDLIKELRNNVLALLKMHKPKIRPLPKKKVKSIIQQPISLSKVIKKISKRQIDMNNLFLMFMKGALEDVVKRAPSLFDTDEKDIALALYGKAALYLLSRPLPFQTPKYETIINDVRKIEDTFLLFYLSSELEGLTTVKSYLKLKDIVTDYRDYIRDIIEKSIILRDLYLITLLGYPDPKVVDQIIDSFRKRSPFITVLALNEESFLQLISRPPRTIEEWMNFMSFMTSRIDRYREKTGWEFLSFSYLLALWWGNSIPNMKMYDTKFIFDTIEKFWATNGEYLVKGNHLLPVHLRGLIWYLGYGLVHYIKILSGGENSPTLSEITNNVENFLAEFYLNFKNNRGIKVLNIVVLSMIADIYSGLLSLNKETSFDLLSIVEEISEEDMFDLWKVNRFYYLLYITSILSILGNSLLVLPRSSPRDLLLKKISEHLSGLSIHAKGLSFINAWILGKALKFYANVKDEESQEQIRRILDHAEERFPEFIFSIFETFIS